MSSHVRETTVSEVVDSQTLSRFQIGTILMCGFVAVLDGFDTQSIGFLAPAIAESLKVPLQSSRRCSWPGCSASCAEQACLGPWPTAGAGDGSSSSP